MEDKLSEVLEAAAMRSHIEPLAHPYIDLISPRTLTVADIPTIRAFQDEILEELELQLVIVGGGYGCTRISISVVANSPLEAKGLIDEIFSSDALREAALKADFSFLLQGGRFRPDEGLRLFYSYAHEDEEYRVELGKHLTALTRQKLIREWHDRKILAGTEWSDQIDYNLERAHIIVLLISSDFLSSSYCYDSEMTCALRRHHDGAARVMPVIVRPVDWEGTPFERLQAVPRDGRAVSLWPDKDEAWTEVAKEIRLTVREIRQSA